MQLPENMFPFVPNWYCTNLEPVNRYITFRTVQDKLNIGWKKIKKIYRFRNNFDVRVFEGGWF